MAPVPPLRRSTRKSQSRKYTLDAFEGIEVPSDVAEEEQEERQSNEGSEVGVREDDGDYDEVPQVSIIAYDGEVAVEDEQYETGSDNLASTSSGDDGEDGEDDDPGTSQRKRRKGADGETEGQMAERGNGTFASKYDSRSYDPLHSAGKTERYRALYGGDEQDMFSAIKCRDLWSNAAVMPSRRPDQFGRGGFHRSFFEPEPDPDCQGLPYWNWFFEHGGEETLKRSQRSRELNEPEGRQYMPTPDHEVRFLIGPWKRQTMATLKTGQYTRVDDLWKVAEHAHPFKGPQRKTRRRREGWMLNAGVKVDDLAWMPSGNDLDTQHLAVALQPATNEPTQIDAFERASVDDPEANVSPAFAPSQPTPACIQLWAFSSHTDLEKKGMMDLDTVPELRLVICTNWGRLVQIRWCTALEDPRARIRPDGPCALLAGVWEDGKARVLRICSNDTRQSVTRYIRVDRAAFESCPPDTICTCVEWISTSEIVVGCANGFVAVWDIAEARCDRSSSSPTSSPNPRPFFYFPLHLTYVLSVASCGPSHPDLIATSGADGHLRLTDTRSPMTDYALAARSRLGSSTVAWCDPIQCVVCSDENNTVRMLSLRRFYGNVSVAAQSATVLCVAVGLVHPTVLTGSADGAIEMFNPMRKMLHSKARSHQLTWFMHEYSRKAGGVSRITEGFKAESPKLLRPATDNRLADGTIPATIFEEKSAVTHAAWSPNVVCGGWAAAAMATGLVRIEDLAT